MATATGQGSGQHSKMKSPGSCHLITRVNHRVIARVETGLVLHPPPPYHKTNSSYHHYPPPEMAIVVTGEFWMIYIEVVLFLAVVWFGSSPTLSPVSKLDRRHRRKRENFKGGLFVYVIPHRFICRPSKFTVSEDAGIEPRTAASLALTARRPYHSARSLIYTWLDLSATLG